MNAAAGLAPGVAMFGQPTPGESVMARSFFLVFVLCVSGTAAAQASKFDYTFAEASYSKADYDNLSTDGDGLGIGVSFAVSNNIHVFGGYAGTNIDSSLDASGWRAGAGLNMPISQLMDVLVQLAYQTTEVKLPNGGSLDDDGLGLRAGVRVGANDWIEVFGGLTYVDLDSGNETVFDAGFLLNLSDAFSVGVSGSWDDDVSVWSLDGRLYF